MDAAKSSSARISTPVNRIQTNRHHAGASLFVVLMIQRSDPIRFTEYRFSWLGVDCMGSIMRKWFPIVNSTHILPILGEHEKRRFPSLKGSGVLF
jgi:hypothetical protein